MKKKGKILPTLFNVGASREETKLWGRGRSRPLHFNFIKNFFGGGSFFMWEILVRGWPGFNLSQNSYKPSLDLIKASLQRITQGLART